MKVIVIGASETIGGSAANKFLATICSLQD